MNMQKEFAPLIDTLQRECSNGPVYYVANTGNWGDALIRQGALSLFRDIGLRYTEVLGGRRRWLLPYLRGGTVIYGGGGAWCKQWDHAERHAIKLTRRFRVIVLPSTYERPLAVPGAVLFCRDTYESQRNVPDATFCHDMAFYLGSRKVTAGKGVGHFFRDDAESGRRVKIPPQNRDISASGTHFSDIAAFFTTIAQYQVVHTDRMHVAIAGCLMDREVHLYAGSYFKSRAVYLSSMHGRFRDVYFHETFDDLATDTAPILRSIA